MAKSNVRSFRFTDEVADLIARQEGRTESEKFERLVLKSASELPASEARLKQVRAEVIETLQQLRDLQSIYQQLRGAETKLSNCAMQLDRLYTDLDSINRKVNSL